MTKLQKNILKDKNKTSNNNYNREKSLELEAKALHEEVNNLKKHDKHTRHKHHKRLHKKYKRLHSKALKHGHHKLAFDLKKSMHNIGLKIIDYEKKAGQGLSNFAKKIKAEQEAREFEREDWKRLDELEKNNRLKNG